MTTDEKRDYIYETLKKELEKKPPSIRIVAPKKISKATLFYVKEVPTSTNNASELNVEKNAKQAQVNAAPISFPADMFGAVSDNVTSSNQPHISSPAQIKPQPHEEPVKEFNRPAPSPDKAYEDDNTATTFDSYALDTAPAQTGHKHDVNLDGYYDEDGEYISVDEMSKKEYKQFLKDKKKEQKYYNRVRKDIHKRGYDTTVLEQFESLEEVYDLTNEEIDQIRAAGFINQDGFYSFIPPADYADIKREAASTKTLLIVCGGILACVVIIIFAMRSIFQMF